MTIENFPSLFNPEEMKQYGFDPDSIADRAEWLQTTPPRGIPAVSDYTQDRFEFGGESAASASTEDQQ